MLQRITKADAVVLRRYDQVHESFHLVAERGLSTDLKNKILYVAKKPIFTNMLRDLKADFRPTINREAWDLGYRQVVSVPLISSQQVVGSVSLLDRSGRKPSAGELRWLELLGRCVAMLIHQVQQAENRRENAILQERTHLAREIHDGLAQMLAAIKLLLEEQRTLLKEGNISAALDLTNHLGLLAEDAYSSIREEILALHDEDILDNGLQAYIEDYLERFENQWGIACTLEVDSQSDEPLEQGLHPTVQSQLIRILQEGLANVRRHAGAMHVRVWFQNNEGDLRVLVEDDGSGFDTDRIPPSAYGLRIMHERAISVGGTIAVRSNSLEGTTLEIVVPRKGIERYGVVK